MIRNHAFPIVCGILLAGYLVFLVSHACLAAGGADSSGYLNEARLLSAGKLVEPVTPVRLLHLDDASTELFMPLGFIRGTRPFTMVPFYPSGLPAHMSLAAMIGGWSLAPFMVSPAAAAASVLLIFLIGRMLGLPRFWAASGAAILALCPIVIFQAVQPMSDVVAMFWALAMIAFALLSRQRSWLAVLSGVAFGIDVWVRPTNAVLIIPLVLALELKPRRLLLAGAGAIPFGLVVAGFNRALYGSAFKTGYGSFLSVLKFHGFGRRFLDYVFWLARLLTPFIIPAGALIIFDRARGLFDRLMLFSWFSVFLAFYMFYEPSASETWWYTRFLLPGIPALILAALLMWRGLTERLDRRSRPGLTSARPEPSLRTLRTAVLVLTVLAILGNAVRFTRQQDIVDFGKGESVYPETVAWATTVVPPHSLILAMQMSGAFHYYQHRAIVRWDMLQPDRFEALRASAFNSNLSFYAVLFPFEAAEFQSHAPGRWTNIASRREITIWRLEKR